MKKYLISTIVIFTALLAAGCTTTEEVVIFDFTGTWTLNTDWDGNVENNPMTLTGSLTNGLVSTPTIDNGTYTSTNNHITMTFYLGPLEFYFTGTVASNTYMSGTFTTNLIAGTGTWQAVR